MGGRVGVVRRKESNVKRIVLQLLVSGELEKLIRLHDQAEETLHVCQSHLYRLWRGLPSLLGSDSPLSTAAMPETIPTW